MKLRGEEVKMSCCVSGLSLSLAAYCLVNRLTCCQWILCECTLAESQSDPPACLSHRGKWRPWYAISGKMCRQSDCLSRLDVLWPFQSYAGEITCLAHIQQGSFHGGLWLLNCLYTYVFWMSTLSK